MVKNSNSKKSDNHMKSLDQFLRTHKYVRGEGEMTHTACGSPYGAFSIPDDELEEFYDIYTNSIGKVPLHLIERPKYVGPLLVDIDYYTEGSEREYTIEHIQDLIRIFNSVIKKYFNTVKKLLKVFVFEKDKPTPKIKEDKNKKKGDDEDDEDSKKLEAEKFKDGFHLIYPNLALPEEMRFLILHEVKKRVEENDTFEGINYINSLDEVFDTCIVRDNGWTMPWSAKKDCTPYRLTKIYKVKTDHFQLEEEDVKNYPPRELVGLLSNRRYKDEDMIELRKGISMSDIDRAVDKLMNKHDRKRDKKVQEKVKDKEKAKLIEQDIDDDDDDDDDEELEKKKGKSKKRKNDVEMAKRLVMIMSNERATGYQDWVRVGWALHNVSYDLLDVFKEFSKKCADKYNERACEKVWEKARDDGYGIGSIHIWARKDNPKKYTKIVRENINELFHEAETGTEYDIAKIIYELYKHQYRCASITYNTWYEFIGHRWVEVQKGHTLQTRLSEEISKEFAKLNSVIWNESSGEEGIRRDDFLKRAANVQKIILNLKRRGFKEKVMGECANLFYEPGFEGKLDADLYLIGFENGVYDLRDGTFRDGTPDDYLTFNVGYDYEEYDENHQYIREIEDFFGKVHRDKPMRHYILKLLASYLDGNTKLQQFIIWTGSGANGKGRTIMLFQLAFGDYTGVLPPTELTRKQGEAGQASPQIAGLRGKRFVVFQEPEGTDQINVGRMKELTGGDIISARPLYKDVVSFKPQFKLLLACNKLPHIPSRDGGTWRRLRVSPWESEFVEVENGLYRGKPLKDHQFPRDYDLDEKLELWKKAFMWLLLNKYYPLYQKEGLKDPETHCEPEKVLMYTRKYERDTDTFLDFFEGEDIEITGNKRDCETIVAVYEVFKAWYKAVYDSKPPNKKEFLEYLAGSDRFDCDKKYIYGLRFSVDENEKQNNIDDE